MKKNIFVVVLAFGILNAIITIGFLYLALFKIYTPGGDQIMALFLTFCLAVGGISAGVILYDMGWSKK